MNGFTEICRLAAALDAQGLYEFLGQGICSVEVSQDGWDSPLATLALAGNHSAVELLINHFGADPKQAIFGYAIAGNQDQAEHLLEKLNYQEKDVLEKIMNGEAAVKLIFIGAACGGHEQWLTELKRNYEHSYAYTIPKWIASGLGLGGYEKIYFQGNFPQYCLPLFLTGLVSGGHFEKFKQYNTLTDEVSHIAYEIANGSRKETAELILTSQPDNLRLQRALLRGYAHSGHSLVVKQILTRHPEMLTVALCEYALGGHIECVNQLLRQSPSDWKIALEGYYRGGHGQLKHKTNALTILVGTESSQAKKMVEYITGDYYPFYSKFSYDLKKLHLQAEEIKKVMTQDLLTYKEALAWTDQNARGLRSLVASAFEMIEKGAIIPDILYTLIQALSSAPLTLKDAEQLCDKISKRGSFPFQIKKKLLLKELDQYADHFSLFKHHRPRAASFRAVCAVADESTLKGLIGSQLNLLVEEEIACSLSATPLRTLGRPPAELYQQPFENIKIDEFSAILEKYSRRLG